MELNVVHFVLVLATALTTGYFVIQMAALNGRLARLELTRVHWHFYLPFVLGSIAWALTLGMW